jgi:starch synthase
MKPAPTVALLPWGDVFEDWLMPLGVTEDEFCETFTGSWMFGYVDALRTAGVHTVIVCFTAAVRTPVRRVHGPTGAAIRFLPAPATFRAVRRRMLDEPLSGRRDPRSVGGALLRQLVPFLATPPVLLARVLRAEGCAAILCQEYETPRFDVCVLVSRLLGVPAFATFQGGDYRASRLEGAARPWTIRAADGLIVASTPEERRLVSRYRVPEARIARVFNPVDTRFWRPEERASARAGLGLPPEATVVVWHGQVQVHRKGLDVLLDAWERVTAERPRRDLRLRLVGTGEDAPGLERRIAAAGLRGVERVDRWVSDRAEVRRLLQAADVYAFPSRHEGFPVAPVEAMACGLPLVAADAYGIPDILERGELDGGVVVPRQDAQALAAALGRLVDDEALRLELGRRARERVERSFSLEAVGAELGAVLARGRTGAGHRRAREGTPR